MLLVNIDLFFSLTTGNIRVFARARPMVSAELKSGKADDVTEYPSPDDIVIHKDALTKARFEFDQVFKPTGSQEEVFENVKPFVTSFLDGFNVCIFAYGQTGSGKVRWLCLLWMLSGWLGVQF